MKVLIADKLPEGSIAALKERGYSLIYDQTLKEEALCAALSTEKPEVVIVRSTKVSGEMIKADPNLHLVIRAGAGFNTIDVDTASQLSVYVANCPGKNAVAVAELAMGLILSLDRSIPDNVIDLRQGKWNKQVYSKADGIFGKTIGIIGVGTIGREVISRAQAFGLHVIGWSRSLTKEKAESLGVGFCGNPVEVAKSADIISVHLAMTTETKQLISREFFQNMKDGAFFINTSRAAVVDETALLEAVQSKNIRAGLDVIDNEPAGKSGEFTGEIKDYPGIYCTHHIGASTKQAQQAVADEVIDILDVFSTTGKVKNCVNLLEKTPAKYVLSVRHRNRVGVLSDVLRIIREADINVESMENIIFRGVEGACANIQIDDDLSEDALKRIEKGNDDIHSVSITSIE
jgi:D-3-phosphoglycerate dehydrogenase / 2-oxoglutarate reductase